jgi:hypothetical protein
MMAIRRPDTDISREPTMNLPTNSRPTWMVVFPLALVAGTIGCSDKLPRTVRVEGRITYQGKPVTQGSVTFMPTAMAPGSSAQPATGSVDPDGNYSLRSYREKDGILPGKYSVSVAAYRSYRLPMKPGEKLDYSIPEKYTSPQTSGLSADVPADAVGPLRFDFELRD